MSSILRTLRDPIWQAIGALIGIIAIFVSVSGSPPSGGELAVVHFQKVKFGDYLLPVDRVKLLVQGSKQEFNEAVVDYFIINNKTSKAILASDYTVPLEVKKGPNTKRLLAVESCTKPLAQKCSADGTSTPSGASYVAFDWVAKGEKWVATPSLLNPGDQSCVVVISEDSGKPTTKTTDRLEWETRVTSVQFRVYGSPADFATNQTKSWKDYVETSVIFSGTAAYWFLLLQGTLFVVTAFLGARSSWISSLSLRDLVRLVFIVVVSTTTSEILIDIFVNHRGDNLHPIVYPLVVLHVTFICYLAYRALRKASSSSQQDVQSGKDRLLTGPPHTTHHAGPQWAVQRVDALD
jgi:hypothetical protein